MLTLFLVVTLVIGSKVDHFNDYFHSTIYHEKPNGQSVHVIYTKPDNISIDNAREILSSYMDPCNNSPINTTNIKVETMPCSQFTREYGPISYDGTDICSVRAELENKTSVRSIPKPKIAKVYYVEDSCQCETSCNGQLISRYPDCTCPGLAKETLSKQADYEPINNCTLVLCDFQIRSDQKDTSFRVKDKQLMNKPSGKFAYFASVNQSMLSRSLYSTYFQRTSHLCALNLQTMMYGSPNGQITVKLVGKDKDDVHELLSVINFQHTKSIFSTKFVHRQIKIGQIRNISRIEIGCSVKEKEGESAECGIAGLSFQNCSDHNFAQHPCDDHVNGFLCVTDTASTCMEDIECDGIVQCPNGDDEKNCNNIYMPICDFSNGRLCKGWKLRSYETMTLTEISPNEMRPLFSLAIASNNGNVTVISDNKTEVVPTQLFHNSSEHGGHFLFYTTQFVKRSYSLGRRTIFSSPQLPPTADFKDKVCTLRFSHCVLVPTEDVYIQVRSVAGEPIVLWKNTLEDHVEVVFGTTCQWTRTTVTIPRQKLPFNIEVVAEHIDPTFGEVQSAGFDDFSLSPGCYHEDQQPPSIPTRWVLDTCNNTAEKIPQYEDCYESALSNGRTEAFVDDLGYQTYVSPKQALHLIKLCGAAGGSVPGHKGQNGTCMYIKLELDPLEELHFLVGQTGQDICSTTNDDWSDESRNIHERLCMKKGETFKWISQVPAAGGGGASLMNDSYNHTLAIAGGGGGAFPVESIDKSVKKSSYADFAAGYGFRVNRNFSLPSFDIYCGELCKTATPDSYEHSAGCGSTAQFMSFGGYGGGGTACGHSGGGGGGYHGGRPSSFGYGERGSSNARFGNFDSEKIEEDANDGEGYVIIEMCDLDCVGGSRCDFIHEDSFEKDCICPGTQQMVDDLCADPPMIRSETAVWPIFVLIVLVLLFIAFYMWNRKYCFGCKICPKSKSRSVSIDLGAEGIILHESAYLTGGADNPLCRLTARELKDITPTIPERLIVIEEEIGKGHFGIVHRGYIKGKENREVAIKTMIDQEADKKGLLLEGVIMNQTNKKSPFTIEMLGMVCTKSKYMLVMEYMQYGPLEHYLHTCRPTLTEDNPRNISYELLVRFGLDVAEACYAIESLQFIHRDLACRNCMLTYQHDRLMVKLGDFGLAQDLRSFYQPAEGSKRSTTLPIKWLPPESIEDFHFCSKTDVWSYGIVMWEILMLGLEPYPRHNAQQAVDFLRKGNRLKKPKGSPDRVYSIMFACWDTDQECRPKFENIRIEMANILKSDALITQVFTPPLCYEEYEELARMVPEPTPTLQENIPETPMTVMTSIVTPGSENSPLADTPRSECPLPSRFSAFSDNSHERNLSQSLSKYYAEDESSSSEPSPDPVTTIFNHSYYNTQQPLLTPETRTPSTTSVSIEREHLISADSFQ